MVIKIFLLFFLLFSFPTAAGASPRVVSLYPGHTDNVVALGAAECIAAISHNDDADSLQALPRLPANVAPEAILAYKPDIVLLRGLNERASPSLVPILTKAGVAVHVIEPPSWEGFETYLRELAAILGVAPARGLAELERIRAEAADAAQRHTKGQKGPLVFLEATGREIHTCSPDSWAARLIELCGGRNAALGAKPVRPGSAVAPWGAERAVMLAAEGLDVYLVQQGAMNASTREDVRARPWFAAFADTQLAFIEERSLSRPSLLGLERGTAALLDILYPEAETVP